MASSSGSSTRILPPEPRPDRDRLIQDELERTRRQLKGVDVTAALLMLSAGVLGYLLLMALIDHWIMPHGLGFTGRIVACAVLVAAVAIYSLVKLLPLLVRRINPIYAAQTIEHSRPSLKNSIINFLLLRSHQSELAPVIYEAVQQRAAADLASEPTESAIDRSRLIKLGYVLLALVAFMALYKVLSPKDPWRSMGRIMAPWANIAVPTRVRIEAIEPGNTQVFQDARVKVSALVRGIGPDDPVTLYYSTADSQVVRQPIQMRMPEGSYRHAVELPDTSSGLSQDATYYITAGDAMTPVYLIHVATSPTITVERVEYKYPAYTELEPRTIERQGDLQAIEGTAVTIQARASHDIKKASVDFERDGKLDLPMQIHGREARVTFPLNLKERQPEHSNYQLHFVNTHGEANANPTMYRIEVIRDLPPEIAFAEPRVDGQQEIALAERGTLRLVVEASDPDFKLQQVTLRARREGRPLLDAQLISEKSGRSGKFRTTYLFEADRHALRTGELVELWAEAEDNKAPEPNRTETARLKIRIGSPQPQQDQLADARNKQRTPPDAPPPDAHGQKGGEQQRQPGAPPENRPNQPPNDGQQPPPDSDPKSSADQDRHAGAPPQDRVDPDDPGKAIEKLTEDAGKQSPQPSDQQQQPSGEQKQANQQQADQQNRGANEPQQDDKQKQSQKQSGGGQGGSGQGKSSQDQNGQQGQSGDGQSGDGQSGGKSDAQKNSTGKQSDQNPASADGKQDSGQGQGNGQGSKPTAAQPQDGQSGGKGSQQQSADDAKDSDTQRGQRSGQQKQADPQAGGKSGDQKGGENMPDGSAGGSGQSQPSSSGGNGGKQSGQGQQAQGQGQQPQGNSDQNQGGQGKSGQSSQSGGKASQNNSGNGGGKSGSANSGDGSSPNGNSQQPSGQSSDKAAGQQQAGGKQQPAGQQPPGSKQDSGGQQQSGAKQDSRGNQSAGKQTAGDPSGNQQSGAQQQPAGQQAPNGQQGGSQQSDGKSTPAAKSDGSGAGQEGMKQQSDGNPSPGGKQEPAGKPAEEDRVAKADESGKGQPGNGADSRQSLDKNAQQPAAGQAQQQGERPGGDRENTQGSAGNGQGKSDEKGTTSPHGDNRARNKQQGNAQSADANNQQPSDGNSPSRSDQESDSKGDTAGDQSGGGQKGGGQRGNQKGLGSAGNNTAADNGGSQANEKGTGDTSGKGGDQQPAGKPVDNAASQGKGPGSKQQAGNSKPGGDSSGNQDSSGDQKSDGQGQQSTGQGNGTKGNPTGGGPSNQNNTSDPGERKEAPPGEDPNLDYARKATDLALDRLKDQLKKPAGDNALLDRLGWTRADAERFVKRWEAMKQAAGKSGAEGDTAKRQLDDALRSLGLRPRGTSVAGNRAGDDQQRNLRQGLRTRPPAEYADQYRAYTTGTSQVQRGASGGQPSAGSK